MSEGVEWGMHAVVLLALAPEGTALPAHRIAESGRTLARWPRAGFESLAQAFAAYWTEERPLVAARDDVAAFNRGVDDLRDGLARLEARLAPLQPRTNRR